jgi:phosphoadenosine phosphosulfate reductase
MNLTLEEIPTEVESWKPEDILGWAFQQFENEVAIASGFGAEGMVLIDMASRLGANFRVFTLDTGFLFPETYALMEHVEKRYGVRIERCGSELTPEEQERIYGPALWASQPDQCCALRKVEPLTKKLAELNAWITAIRRDQTAARANTPKVGWDAKFGLIKVNPLADWTWRQVWEYIRAHGVPYNPLHDRNYPSIGCTHCTRRVETGEDLRAGRWSGFQKSECGLHSPSQVKPAVRIQRHLQPAVDGGVGPQASS